MAYPCYYQQIEDNGEYEDLEVVLRLTISVPFEFEVKTIGIEGQIFKLKERLGRITCR